ncbi:hypothetical protein [Paenilisteria rocourtiae]|uniref:Uncharacterized protein n=1 Tax=Listeria rocourtiae TaxID=647910 RepID=A0A4R6ZQV6_9LIST|nr:hypothetical protein [Listeria rocourtiae]TDR54529.1 hypothetical protein DFP96_102115 [Listeria rocourtiae]
MKRIVQTLIVLSSVALIGPSFTPLASASEMNSDEPTTQNTEEQFQFDGQDIAESDFIDLASDNGFEINTTIDGDTEIVIPDQDVYGYLLKQGNYDEANQFKQGMMLRGKNGVNKIVFGKTYNDIKLSKNTINTAIWSGRGASWLVVIVGGTVGLGVMGFVLDTILSAGHVNNGKVWRFTKKWKYVKKFNQ